MIFTTIIYIVVFLALFLLVRLIVKKGSEESARRALGIETKSKVVKSPIIKILRPAFSIFLPLARAIQSDTQRRKRRQQFMLASMSEEMTPEEFLAYQMLTGTIVAVFMLLYNFDGSLLVSFVMVVLGFLFPYKWLLDRIKIRTNAMVKELPLVVDMLALSTRAGLGFVAGIERLTRKRKPSPLMEELTTFLQEVQMGANRQDALRNMASRCDSPEMNQFIIVLIQASNLGVPISRVLRAQSEKMRSERFQKAERLGAEATQKILFPLIFIIMPAVLIVVLGPLVITFLMS